MKLNIGCGYDIREGWINVDVEPKSDEVIKCDFIWSLPFDDDYFEVVEMKWVIEHIPIDDVDRCLKEISRVMKLGGLIRIQTADFSEYVKSYINKTEDFEEIIRSIFGEQHCDAMRHKSVFDMPLLKKKLEDVGFREIVRKISPEAEVYDPCFDMIVEGKLAVGRMSMERINR